MKRRARLTRVFRLDLFVAELEWCLGQTVRDRLATLVQNVIGSHHIIHHIRLGDLLASELAFLAEVLALHI